MPTGALADGAVTTAKIADTSVTPAKLGRTVASGSFGLISSTSNNVITGIGFNPRTIKITAMFSQGSTSTHSFAMSVGVYDRIAGTQSCVAGTAGNGVYGGGLGTSGKVFSIQIPFGTIASEGTISATTTDGFTLNVTTAGGVCVLWEARA